MGYARIDPSIIPALALDRVDVLVDGASATYGSDAIAGVINVILKRGFDGAVTLLHVSSLRMAAARNIRRHNYGAAPGMAATSR